MVIAMKSPLLLIWSMKLASLSWRIVCSYLRPGELWASNCPRVASGLTFIIRMKNSLICCLCWDCYCLSCSKTAGSWISLPFIASSLYWQGSNWFCSRVCFPAFCWALRPFFHRYHHFHFPAPFGNRYQLIYLLPPFKINNEYYYIDKIY